MLSVLNEQKPTKYLNTYLNTKKLNNCVLSLCWIQVRINSESLAHSQLFCLEGY